MNRRLFLLRAALASLPAAQAQGVTVFPPVRPGTALEFPRDHAAHPEFRTEWWYVTGQLADRDGRDYGFQVTFFRSRPGVAEDSRSRFAARQLVIAHAALSDRRERRLLHDQRAARAVFDLAGASTVTTRAWIGDWSLEREGVTYTTSIAARGFALALRCAVTQPPLLHGDAGYSRKGPAPQLASHYYSLPQLAVEGSVTVGATTVAVVGRAWLDHEWSSEVLAPGAAGWDWLGANLDDGGALMAFVMRDRAGAPLWAAATLRDATGQRTTWSPAEVRFIARRRWRSPRSDALYPVAQDVVIGARRFAVVPWFDDQEQDGRASTGTVYWEGAADLAEHGVARGRGYLELTGYAAPLSF